MEEKETNQKKKAHIRLFARCCHRAIRSWQKQTNKRYIWGGRGRRRMTAYMYLSKMLSSCNKLSGSAKNKQTKVHMGREGEGEDERIHVFKQDVVVAQLLPEHARSAAHHRLRSGNRFAAGDLHHSARQTRKKKGKRKRKGFLETGGSNL